MGSVASIFTPSVKPKPRRADIVADATSARRAKEKEEKKKIAFKLAQLATGAGGLFSSAQTSRKKLLGN